MKRKFGEENTCEFKFNFQCQKIWMLTLPEKLTARTWNTGIGSVVQMSFPLGMLTGAMLLWGCAIFYKTNHGVLVVLVPTPKLKIWIRSRVLQFRGHMPFLLPFLKIITCCGSWIFSSKNWNICKEKLPFKKNSGENRCCLRQLIEEQTLGKIW